MRAHDPQLDEEALKWWSWNASDEDTEGDGDEAKGQRDTPIATGKRSDLESITTDEHDKDLTSDFCKKPVSKWFGFCKVETYQ